MPDSPPSETFAKAVMRHMVTVLVMAFIFGGWIMRQQIEIQSLKIESERQRVELREWWEWRNGTNSYPDSGVNAKLSRMEGKITDLYSRVKKSEHDP